MAALNESLIAALGAGRDLEAVLIADCDDAPAAESGRWTARDHLAHIAHYRDFAAEVLDAVRTGAPGPDEDESELEARNAAVYAENRHRSAEAVRDRAEASHLRLAAAVERCTELDLRKRRRPAEDAVAVWRLVPGCGWGHVAQHVAQWHLEHGDGAAAERAARRAHEIDMANIEDEEHRASSTYNLGCFYALAGRPEEALALVEKALAAWPPLREWAPQDPDLASIRDRLTTL